MMNPFKKFVKKTGDSVKDKLHARIETACFDIVMKTLKGKVTTLDVDTLENLYKEYYFKYPDKDAEIHAEKQIRKLRVITI